MKRTIKNVIIHCAATPNGKAFNAADIDVMHGLVKPRPFNRSSQWIKAFNPQLKHIGYHFVILIDGTIETGRALEEIGAHVQGNNATSIGICMIGTDKFTRAQWDALRKLLIELAGTIKGKVVMTSDSALELYRVMSINVKGHRDYSPDLNGNGKIERNEWVKICPGFDMATFIKGGMMPLGDSLWPS